MESVPTNNLPVRYLRLLWQRLTEPTLSLQGMQRQQAKLLASFIVVFILLILAACVAKITLDAEDVFWPRSALLSSAIMIGILLITYKLSHTKFYPLAALITLYATTMLIFVVSWSHPILLNYLVIPVLISAVFFPLRLSNWFTFVVLVGILFYAAFISQDSFSSNLLGPFAFTAIVSIVLLVAVHAWKVLELQQQAQLVESETNFRAVYDFSSQPMWVYDLETLRFLDVNEATTTLYGYSRAEFLQMCTTDLQVRKDVSPSNENVKSTQLALQPDGQWQHRLKDGRIIEVEIVEHRLQLSGRSAVIALAQDITDRKRAETALQQERSLLRTLVDTLPENVYVKDVESRFLMANKVTSHILGAPQPSALIGKTDFEFFPKELAAEYYADERQIMASGQPIFNKQEPLLVMSTGESRWISTTKVPVRGEHGEIVGIVGIGHDVTERKQMEEELREHRTQLEKLVEERTVDLRQANQQLQTALEKEKELNELKTQFVTMVSHQFRTPLTIIAIYSDVLQNYNDKLSDEQKLMRFTAIQAEIAHLTQLIEDVLTLGKAEAKQLQLTLAPLNLKDYATALASDIDATIGANHHFVFSYTGQRDDVVVDKDFLQRILVNLLANAFKYSPAGSSVQLDVRVEHEQVVFRIQDAGMGISPEAQPRLFEAFHRAANVSHIRGTGLGLNIVKHFVDLHHGTIAFESTVGVGTTFIVTIPLQPPSAGSDSLI